MTPKLQNEIIVLELAGDQAIVECADPKLADQLVKLGFSLEKDKFYSPIPNMDVRIDISRKLIGLGALFSHGKDWSPADLLQYFSESGLISGKYRTVAWKGPADVVIREN